jgi:fibronectin type 3 domain-containing protein
VLTELTYTDTTAADGQTYDYIVESVDAQGNLSSPSNIYTAVIP